MSKCWSYYTCVEYTIRGDDACDDCISSILDNDNPECQERKIEAAKKYLDNLKKNTPSDGMFLDYFDDGDLI